MSWPTLSENQAKFEPKKPQLLLILKHIDDGIRMVELGDVQRTMVVTARLLLPPNASTATKGVISTFLTTVRMILPP